MFVVKCTFEVENKKYYFEVESETFDNRGPIIAKKIYEIVGDVNTPLGDAVLVEDVYKDGELYEKDRVYYTVPDHQTYIFQKSINERLSDIGASVDPPMEHKLFKRDMMNGVIENLEKSFYWNSFNERFY